MSVTTIPVTAMLIAQTPQMEVTRVHARPATQEMVTLLAQVCMRLHPPNVGLSCTTVFLWPVAFFGLLRQLENMHVWAVPQFR